MTTTALTARSSTTWWPLWPSAPTSTRCASWRRRPTPYDPDRDLHVFRRSTVEGILGFPLNADLLAADTWNATRDQVMTTHTWDAIWESSDVD